MRFERLCAANHQWTADTAGAVSCSTCGAEARLDHVVPVDDGPFVDVTTGAELWFMSIGSLEAAHRWFFQLAIADWFARTQAHYNDLAVALAVWRGLRGLCPPTLGNCKTIPGREVLHVDLSQAELAEMATEMAQLSARITDNEEAKKVAVSRFKAVHEDLVKQLEDIGKSVRGGAMRAVDVLTIHDYRTCTCTRVRQDTGEIILERPLTAEERQREMFDEPKNEKKSRNRKDEQPGEAAQA